MSTSLMHFTESDPAHTLLALMEQALRERYPEVDWRCTGDLLYISEGMARRARTLVERHNPDVAIVRPTSLTFMHDDVISAIRDRWPRLYRAAVALGERLRWLSGGLRWGGAGPRGLIFRVPRWLAVKVIGEAPRIPVELATDYVRQTLDALSQIEALSFTCHLAVGNDKVALTPEEEARRRDYFVENLRAYCRERLVPFSNARDIMLARGITYDYGPDQWHTTLPYRTTEAETLATQVAVAAGLSPSAVS
jgi:hypothetical protein